PVLLHEHAAEPEVRGDGGDLARVVRLDAADRDERVAAGGERVGDEVLELAHLVAAVREPRVAVVALRPELDLAAEVRAQPLEPVDRRRAEEQRDALEVGEAHGAMVAELPKASSSMCTSPTRPKPRRSRIGRDIGPPCVINAGVPSATASSQRARIRARYAPRPRARGRVAPP